MPTAEDARRKIVEHGMAIHDRIVESLPPGLGLMVEQVRSISRTYKGDLDTFLTNLATVKNIDNLITYIALLAVLNKYKSLSDEELRRLGAAFERYVYDVVSASRLRKALEEAGIEKEVANETISTLLRALGVIHHKHKALYLWIAKQRRLANFERGVREVFFRGEGGNKVGRGVKLLLRMFIHDTNIPLAIKIAYSQEYKKYLPHGDMYTALVTLRSGAFEDVASLTAERVKARVAKRLLCEARGEKCKDVVIRLESIRGLVRHVAKISGDPVLYERGAYDIGVKYCKDLKCEACPIRDVCKRFIFIRLR